MRQKNRELSPEQTLRVLNGCDVCRIALSTQGAPYIVPLSFGVCEEEGAVVVYFHCASEGRKLSLLAANPLVGFEADTAHRLVEGERACDYTMAFESVIGEGTLSAVTDEEQKRHGLLTLMAHYSDRGDFTFSEDSLDRVTVLRLSVSAMTGKRLVPKPRA